MSADIPMARLFDLTGLVLGGRYEVLRKLGEGGMASVYEGRRIGLRNRVAIKVLKPDLCEDPTNIKRFLREAKAASVIEHDNIVDIVDFGEVDVLPVYYVMEFLEGEDLKDVIKKLGPLPWEQFGPILLQICSALAAAHDAGIVHRDVKPANIYLVARHGEPPLVKVLDFGIAKVVDNGRGMTKGMTMTNGILGTVAYMAPEQARGEQLDARTDIYQLGVVMYQALTGTVPFSGRNPFVVLGQHVNDPPRPPREIRPDIPQAVESIILTCLSKDPAERFQSMRALRNAALGLVPRQPEHRDPLPPPSVAPVALGDGAMGWAPPQGNDLRPAHTITETEKLGSGSHRTVPPATALAADSLPSGVATEAIPRGSAARAVRTTAPPGLAHPRVTAPAGTSAGADRRPATATAPDPTYRIAQTDPRPRASMLAIGFGVGVACMAVLAVGYVVTIEVRRDETPVAPELGPQVIEAAPITPAPTPVIPSRPTGAALAPPAPSPEPVDAVEEPPAPEPRPTSRRPPRPPRPRDTRTDPSPAPTPTPAPRETPPPPTTPEIHPDLKNAYPDQ
jgi:serine/threonine protein kinase